MPRAVTLTLSLVAGNLVLKNEQGQIKAFRISELNNARLGAAVLQLFMNAQNAPESKSRGQDMPTPRKPRDFQTVPEFARENHLSVATVKRMCAAGELKAQKFRGRWRIFVGRS